MMYRPNNITMNYNQSNEDQKYHPCEEKILEASLENGLELSLNGKSYSKQSVQNLPKPLQNYWMEKQKQVNEGQKVIEAGDKAIEWIKENQSFKRKIFERLSIGVAI